MDDRTLYATILGIAAPWDVARVELDDAAKAVHVWLEARSGTPFACPECQTISPLHDHVERSWRHLDTCQYETRLHARVPRVDCAEHGVKTVPVPWATAHSRFTMLFERLRRRRRRWRDASASRGKKRMESSSGPCSAASRAGRPWRGGDSASMSTPISNTFSS